MNYKKILKNQKLRFMILSLLNFIPDKMMIKLQYYIKTGRKLDLNNPKRYSEKIQWYKLYYRNPIMHKCVDKLKVRDFIKEKGLSNILNELYGVYNKAEDIKFDDLPQKFVIKTTLGGGGLNVFICNDKKKLDYQTTIQILNTWLKNNPKKSYGREWAYEGGTNKLIIEKLIDNDGKELIDYKFFCFNGKISYVYVITERDMGKSAKLGIYDASFKKIDAYRQDEKRQDYQVKKPKNYDKMCDYAQKISKDFPHARVDFYNVNGNIIFGEITFYDGSGYMKYDPDSFDFEMGRNMKLEKYL